MRSTVKTVLGVLIAATTTLASTAFAQQPVPPDYQTMRQPPAPMPQLPPPPEAQQAEPPAYYPAAQQARPPAYYPAPAAVTVAAPAPSGQWVYTNQYGWVWMPYGANYTYVTAHDVAFTYAYYPHFGWRWIAAPWVMGMGPSPRWGHHGPVHFAWYGHPRFRGFAPRHGWHGRSGHQAPVIHVGRRGGWHDGGHRRW
jgi:hypothetical protein